MRVGLQDRLCSWLVASVVCLLGAMLCGVAAVKNEIMEVTCATNAVDLLIFVRCGARAVNNVSNEDGIHAGAMAAAPCVVRLGRVATLAPMTDVVRGKIAVGSYTRVVLVSRRVVTLAVSVMAA